MADPQALYESDDFDWLRKPDRDVEGPWVERKENFDAHEIARQISAFANAQPPGGLIVVGCDQAGKRLGLRQHQQKAYADVSKLPLDGHEWQHRFATVDGDELLLIRVPFSADRVVCLSDGRAFVRKGSSTIELKPAEILELRYARGERQFEDEPIVPYEPSAVDPMIAEELLAGIRERNGLTLPRTLEEALADKGLTVQRGDEAHLTVAGLLAIGRKPTASIPGARVHFQRFDGTQEKFGTERNVTKEQWFDGPTKQMLQQVHEFVGTLVSEFDRLGDDGRFITEPEYPRTAWEEAIVNAVAHRSYSLRNAPIEIRMFDDRLEVESPGGYPGPQRPTEEGVFPFSYPRNPNLGHALRYLGLVRLAKEGTRRMSEEMKKLGLPVPKYEELHGARVRVTLLNDIERRRESKPDTRQWDEIRQLLGQDLAIYRRRAVQKWQMSRGPGRPAPKEVVEEAGRIIRDSDVPPEEKRPLLDMLRGEPPENVAELARKFAMNLRLPVDHVITHPHLAESAADFISRSEQAVDALMELLNQRLISKVEAQRLAFQALNNRLVRDPLPPPEWMQRALRACGAYPAVSDDLYLHITGRRRT